LVDQGLYTLRVSGPAKRAIAARLPESVAAAVVEFVTGDLLLAPHRVGKKLRAELTGQLSARRGTYRVIYTIDDENRIVTVLVVEHRRDVYRPH